MTSCARDAKSPAHACLWVGARVAQGQGDAYTAPRCGDGPGRSVCAGQVRVCTRSAPFGDRVGGSSRPPPSWIVAQASCCRPCLSMLVVSGGCLVLLLVGPRLGPVEKADTAVAGQAVR